MEDLWVVFEDTKYNEAQVVMGEPTARTVADTILSRDPSATVYIAPLGPVVRGRVSKPNVTWVSMTASAPSKGPTRAPRRPPPPCAE